MHQRSLVNKQGHIGSITVFTYSISVLFFQLMATGEYGASGAHVRRLVNRENNQEPVNVIHQPRSMEERNVMARHRRVKFVTTTYPAQVSLMNAVKSGHFRDTLSLCFKTSFMKNLSHKSKFSLS